MKTLVAALFVLLIAIAATADETLYRYEGDVHPLDPSTGWGEGGLFNPCEPPCSDFIEDGRYVLVWSEAGDNVGYHRWIARAPELPPPTLWVEWRFRSNFPLGPIFSGCDASFSIRYRNVSERVELTGDSIITFSGSDLVLGLKINEFHTYRFESADGINYSWSVDGDRFVELLDNDVDNGNHFVQMRGQGGCNSDQMPNLRNAWDFVRYGELDSGERIVATDPPQGTLFLPLHTLFDRFTVTFDAANYVYLDEITVQSTSGVTPTVIATRRRDFDEPDTVEIVLNQPISTQGTTTFTFDDGQTTNVVSYRYSTANEDSDNDGVPNGDDLDPFDPSVCRDADGDLCDDCSIGVDGDGPLPDFDPANDGLDTDGDGVCDLSDNCIDDPNPSQGDGDGDGVGDACDGCPSGESTTDPGVCGCAVPGEGDADGDGVGDACDRCPTDGTKSHPGICGCGVPDEGDADGDTVLDCVDRCPDGDDTIDEDDNGVPDCAGNIPTVSAWGLVVLTLFLLAAGKVFFSRRAAVP